MNSTELASEWKWARGLTIDLLKSCSSNDLNFHLDSSCGALWKQFRHIGRVHENYLTALQTKQIVFEVAGCSYTGGPSTESLLIYFEDLAKRHDTLLKNIDPQTSIDWFGESAGLSVHLTRLLAHETLHHGQLILHWRVLGNRFPQSWSSWGE